MLVEERHSGYFYDPMKLVSSEQILQLANAARLSPSCYNEQPSRLIFCDKKKSPEAYQKALSCLVEDNQTWAKNVPLLIIVSAETKSSHQGGINRWAEYDTGAAAMSLVYQATALGLMAHEMGGFDSEKTKKVFNLPQGVIPLAVIAVGYESESEQKNIPSKKRHPLKEISFLGNWEQELKLN